MSTYGEAVAADPVHVLVVEAGPTGLATAVMLNHHGIRARIIDRSLERAQESRALAIQPRTLEVLAPLGVTEHLVNEGNRNVQLRMHAPGRAISVPMFDLGAAGHRLPIPAVSVAVRNRAHPGRTPCRPRYPVEHGTELTALRQHPDAVTVTLRHRCVGGAESSRGLG